MFSAIDQKGIDISVHKLDGAVRRNFFPSSVSSSCQSLGIPLSSLYGANTGLLSFTASRLNVYSDDLVKNQISSIQFFQLLPALLPFSLSHVMRFFNKKYLPAISGMAIDVFQSEQMYKLPLGFSEINTSASHLSIQRL